MIAAALPLLSLGIGFGAGSLLAGEKVAPEAISLQSDAGEKEAKAMIDAAAAKEKAANDDHDTHAAESHKPAAKAHEVHGSAPSHGALPPGSAVKNSRDVVKLGQVTIPIYKPRSVTYVVADLGVAMPDSDTAAHYRIAENAVRLRDNIMSAFREATENPKMRRANIDSDWLSKTLTDSLRSEFSETEEVLFLSLFKKDVPRS